MLETRTDIELDASDEARPGSSRPVLTVAEVVQKEFLGPEDIAVLLDVSLHTVRAWRKRDYLPSAYRLGKLLRWRRVIIEEWVRSHLESARRPGLRYNGRTRLSRRAMS